MRLGLRARPKAGLADAARLAGGFSVATRWAGDAVAAELWCDGSTAKRVAPRCEVREKLVSKVSNSQIATRRTKGPCPRLVHTSHPVEADALRASLRVLQNFHLGRLKIDETG